MSYADFFGGRVERRPGEHEPLTAARIEQQPAQAAHARPDDHRQQAAR